MLSRHIPPLPPVFGCVLTQTPSSTLALRFVETKLPNPLVKEILSTKGKQLLKQGYVLISNERTGVGAVINPESEWESVKYAMEKYAIQK